MHELIPESESIGAWTDMLTVQVLRNSRGWTLEGFHRGMAEAWADMCPCGSTEIIERGREDPHPTLIWMHACPLNRQTGKPEHVWFKLAIRDGHLMIAQKAFRYQPEPEQVASCISLLRDLRITHSP